MEAKWYTDQSLIFKITSSSYACNFGKSSNFHEPLYVANLKSYIDSTLFLAKFNLVAKLKIVTQPLHTNHYSNSLQNSNASVSKELPNLNGYTLILPIRASNN